MNRIKNTLLLAAVVMGLVACSPSVQLVGKYSGELRFSAWEIMSAKLMLLDDSTFFYWSRPDEQSEFTAYAGHWRLQGKTLQLDAGSEWQLWLRPNKNGLEVLDVDQQAVIGGNKLLLLADPMAKLPIESMNIKGNYWHRAGASMFTFCGSSLQLPVLMEEANPDLERMFFHQMETDETAPLTVSVFARMVIESDEELSRMSLIISRVNRITSCR
jgi:hypothetical protein